MASKYKVKKQQKAHHHKQQTTLSESEKQHLIGLYSSGQLQQACNQATKLLEKYHKHSFLLNILGSSHAALGRHEDAIKCFRKSLKHSPDDVDTHNNFGNFLLSLERKDEAIKHFQKAIQLKPDQVIYYRNLGQALLDTGNDELVIKTFRKVIQLKPEDSDAHNILGCYLNKADRYQEAVNHFTRAIQLNPDCAESFNNMGTALSELGYSEQAARSYHKATTIKPDFAEAYNNLGIAMNTLGKKAEAISSISKALEINPKVAKYYRGLIQLKKVPSEDPILQRLNEIYQKTEDVDEKVQACFALGRSSEYEKGYDNAFKYYAEGNALRKQQLGHNPFSNQKKIEWIIDFFTRQAKEDPLPNPASEKKPILIVGMPRSGTTLTEQILASHSTVHGAGELKELARLGRKHFMGHNSEQSFNLIECCRKMTADYDKYIQATRADESIIVDKMPANFMWVGFLMLVCPNLKVIQLDRDPRAVSWSIFKQYFPNKGLSFSFDLEDIVDYYKQYLKLMDFWHQRFPGRIYTLCYEELTENQEEETRKLLEYCDLDWEDQCLEFHKTKRSVKTASVAQVRQKMYRGSSEEWLKYEKHLGPMFDKLKELEIPLRED